MLMRSLLKILAHVIVLKTKKPLAVTLSWQGRKLVAGNVRGCPDPIQDYKSLLDYCATLVNTLTDTQTDAQKQLLTGYTISSAS